MFQRIPGEGVGFDGFSFDQMLLDDFFEHFGSAGVIPDAFRVNDGDGAIHAYAQTVGFGAKYERFWTGKLQLFQARLEILPGAQTFLALATFRLGLIGTQEDVPLELFQAEFFDVFLNSAHWVWGRRRPEKDYLA